MPLIPSVSTFVEKNLHQRATFFGCNDTKTLTIIFLPNVKYSYSSNPASSQFDYAFNETAAMIDAGNKIATQNGDPAWAGCLGCAIVHKNGEPLPSHCGSCLQKYCYMEEKQNTAPSPPNPSSKPTVAPRSNSATRGISFTDAFTLGVGVFAVALLL